MSEVVGVYAVDGPRFSDRPRYFSTLYPAAAESWDNCEAQVWWWSAGGTEGER